MTAAKVKESSKDKVAMATKKVQKTKRQKRMEGSNPSTAWAQQPRIKSMESRDKAYLRIAGFGNAKKNTPTSTEQKEKIDPDKDFINSPEYKFGRLLASPETRTRHATILKLKQYLQARTDPQNSGGGLSVLDLMKLWKGMWHTLYLCDGVAVQQEVSKVLAELMWAVGGTAEEDEYAGRLYLEMEEEDEEMMAEDGENEDGAGDENDGNVDGSDDDDDDDDDEMQIVEMMDSSDEDDAQEEDSDEKDLNEEVEQDEEVDHPANDEETKHCRGAHLSALYVRTYLRTLTREWSNMDKYRIDKFYTLTRLMLREIYRYAASRHWNLGIIRLFNDAIFEEVLRMKGNSSSTKSYGNGIRFHILDICLEELARVNSEKDTGLPLTEATFLDCLEPFFAMAQRCEQKLVHKRVVEKVIMRFLEEYSVVSDNYVEKTDSSKGDEDERTRSLIMDQVHVGTVGHFIFELASDTETADRYRSQLYDIHKTYMRRIKSVGRDVDMTEDDETDDMTEEATMQEEKEAEEPEPEPEKKRSKKKRKKESSKREPDNMSSEVSGNEEDETQKENLSVEDPPKQETKKKRKKKNKKKSNTEKESAPVAVLTEEEEEIITISKKEQKAAAKAVAKAAKDAAKAQEALQTPKRVLRSERANRGEESGKRVKFGKMNSSKSYKASMKDLKKVNPKMILEKTPEKSILLKKDKKKRRKVS